MRYRSAEVLMSKEHGGTDNSEDVTVGSDGSFKQDS